MTNRGFDFLYSLQKISKAKQNLFTRQTVKLLKENNVCLL